MIAMKTFRYFYEVLFTVSFNSIFKLVVISIINSFWYQVMFVGRQVRLCRLPLACLKIFGLFPDILYIAFYNI